MDDPQGLLLLPCFGILRGKRYTFKWLSLLIQFYLLEGTAQATSDHGLTSPGDRRNPALRGAVCRDRFLSSRDTLRNRQRKSRPVELKRLFGNRSESDVALGLDLVEAGMQLVQCIEVERAEAMTISVSAPLPLTIRSFRDRRVVTSPCASVPVVIALTE